MPEANDPNPYEVPDTALEQAPKTSHDEFILAQVTPLLKPREKLRFTATLFQSPSPWVLIALCMVIGVGVGLARVALADELAEVPVPLIGGVIGMLIALAILPLTRPFLVAVTSRRIVLFRTRLGAFGMRKLNLGVDEIRWRDVERVKVGGFANNRSLTFVFADQTQRVMRISPWTRAVSGQKAFFEYAQHYVPRSEREAATE